MHPLFTHIFILYAFIHSLSTIYSCSINLPLSISLLPSIHSLPYTRQSIVYPFTHFLLSCIDPTSLHPPPSIHPPSFPPPTHACILDSIQGWSTVTAFSLALITTLLNLNLLPISPCQKSTHKHQRPSWRGRQAGLRAPQDSP